MALAEEPKEKPYIVETEVRPLPGSLDTVPMFNSNSPEVVRTSGVLLSLLPKVGKTHPEAHLDYPLKGKFRVFTHHINNRGKGEDKVLFLGLLAYNPDDKPATVRILRAASYLSQPDAPFIKLPPYQVNNDGLIYAGPGDRVTNDYLRGDRQTGWPSKVTVPANGYAIVYSLPVQVRAIVSHSNGRSSLLELSCNKNIHLAEVADFVKVEGSNSIDPPSLERYVEIATTHELSQERDKVPSVPGAKGPLIYGRVAGVQTGCKWTGTATDGEKDITRLTIPEVGNSLAFPVCSLERGTFATGQVQSAVLAARYPDTAYAAHGNYAVEYRLQFPLYNPAKTPVEVSVSFDTPLKTDQAKDNLTYFEPPAKNTFYRGTLFVQYLSDKGDTVKRYTHLVQTRGTKADELFKITMKPKGRRTIKLSLFYPPDATPPQVITFSSRPAE
ncbi:MAG: DUF3370 domain-containing protein [Candidatus Melainabacteria bacterium]|jgi:hypothetical protein|nr:DUF3370 domain-containing protein [Candidatus Melainabacteria bacterium]